MSSFREKKCHCDRIAAAAALCIVTLACTGRADLKGIEGKLDKLLNVPAPPGSFAEMLDFRSIPRLKTWRTLQASGYDRKGGYYDSGNFLRAETGRRYVLMDANGPGCIDRMWFTYKKPIGREPYDLLIYIDEPNTPVIHTDLDQLFSGEYIRFFRPLAGLCGAKEQPARFSYVPIGFQRSCKVVLVPRAPEQQYNYRLNSDGLKIPHIYYQITYRKFEPATHVKTFQWEMDPLESQTLAKLRSVWLRAGAPPWGQQHDLKNDNAVVTLEPQKKAPLFDVAGPGIIYALEIYLENPHNLQLEMLWDDAFKADVKVPLGPFFACADSNAPQSEVRSLWTGCLRGRYYCYLPMPFRNRARISITSKNRQSILLMAKLQYESELLDATDGRFCAHRYDYTSPQAGQNYTVLDTKASGVFIGLVMDNPGNMEGDDFFFIDGEQQPSIHGTGTEDFFNFAWGLSHTASLPMHGITTGGAGPPVCYRFNPPAGVPFERSLLVSWEHGHDVKKGPNLDTGRYSGIAFYYRHSPGQ